MMMGSGVAGLPRRYLGLAIVVLISLWILLRPQHHPTSASHIDDISDRVLASITSSSTTFSFVSSPWLLIPRKIWQTATPVDQDTRNVLENSWNSLNPTWRYEILNHDGAATFVNETFANTRPDIVDVYHRIETPIIKVDLLRYLLVLHYGGLYADVDVDCVKSIDIWLPEEMRQRAGIVLGLEYDDTIHEDMPNISIAQYVFMARPGHPILEAVVTEALLRLQEMGDRASPYNIQRPGIISAGKPQDILEATGPYMFSSVILEAVQKSSPEFKASQLHHIREPFLINDVMILPINSFGWGQEHSRSGELDMGEILAEHHFRRSWRNPITWDLDFSWQNKGRNG